MMTRTPRPRGEGAEFLAGGERESLGDELSRGYYIQPTLLKGNNKMRVFQEEIFGPVMQLLKFKDLDDAIKRANNTIYGLAAGVCTRDVGTALHCANALQAGTVWVNCYDNFDM